MEKFIFLIIALIVVNLAMEKLKEKVDYIIQIQIFILETGEKIKLMDMVKLSKSEWFTKRLPKNHH